MRLRRLSIAALLLFGCMPELANAQCAHNWLRLWELCGDGCATDSIVTVNANEEGVCQTATALGLLPHTTDTGPSPDCSGTSTYQDGEGNCDTLDGLEDFETAGDDCVVVGNGSTFDMKCITDCDAAESRLQYDTATNQFSCAGSATNLEYEINGQMRYDPTASAEVISTSFQTFAYLMVTGNVTTYTELAFVWSGLTASRTYEYQLVDGATVIASGSRASTFANQLEQDLSLANEPSSPKLLLLQFRVTSATGSVILNGPPVLELQQ